MGVTWKSCENSDSDPAGLSWGLGVCIYNQVPGGTHATGPQTQPEQQGRNPPGRACHTSRLISCVQVSGLPESPACLVID